MQRGEVKLPLLVPHTSALLQPLTRLIICSSLQPVPAFIMSNQRRSQPAPEDSLASFDRFVDGQGPEPRGFRQFLRDRMARLGSNGVTDPQRAATLAQFGLELEGNQPLSTKLKAFAKRFLLCGDSSGNRITGNRSSSSRSARRSANRSWVRWGD